MEKLPLHLLCKHYGYKPKYIGKMNRKIKHKTDNELIAETYGVSVQAVKMALNRRKSFPNNRLVKAHDKLQKAKASTLRKLVA